MTRLNRFYLALFIVTFIIGFNLANVSHAKPLDRLAGCRYQTSNENVSWTRWEVAMTLRCASVYWHVDRRILFQIVERESGFRATAENSYSGACGLGQMLPRYWASVWYPLSHLNGQPSGHSCFNARTNALAMVHYAHLYGWAPWNTYEGRSK